MNWQPSSARKPRSAVEAAEEEAVALADLARGSLVDPGSYVVTIAASGKTDSKTFTVEEDPRVQLSDDDRAKRRKTLTTLSVMTRDADAARRKIVGDQYRANQLDR